MTGTLRTGEDRSGEEAINAYLAWRKRHLVESDSDGSVAVRLVPAQRREPETSVRT